MAGTAVLGRLNWQVCDVAGSIRETPTVRSLVLDCPGWPGHLPGQHVDLRLTAEDGYQAERSYSLATPRQGERIQLTIQRLPDGEVSPYLCDELRPGDRLELRGPIGGYFVWKEEETGPVVLLGGGSGIVPLMAILTARVQDGRALATRLLVSARSFDDLVYRAALERLAAQTAGVELFMTLTRSRPPGWSGYSRRVDQEMLREVAWMPGLPAGALTGAGSGGRLAPGGGSPAGEPLAYVCGPTAFVETVADSLVDLGYAPERIRTERFGPTGV
jgi:ferredoxin-NADP reductase